MLTSDQPACKCLQQITGKKKHRGQSESREPSQPEMLQVGHIPKMVQDKITQWEEVEHLNKDGAALKGERSPWEKVKWSLWQLSFRKSMKMKHISGYELE